MHHPRPVIDWVACEILTNSMATELAPSNPVDSEYPSANSGGELRLDGSQRPPPLLMGNNYTLGGFFSEFWWDSFAEEMDT